MEGLKYEVIKMRGIAFRDPQKVYTKGSEVGYSLATIEKILSQKHELKVEPKLEILHPKSGSEKHLEKTSQAEKVISDKKNNQAILESLLKPESAPVEGINQSLINEQRKCRKKQKHRHL